MKATHEQAAPAPPREKQCKHCTPCHAQVFTAEDFCPLCGAALEQPQACPAGLPQNPYPDLRGLTAQSNFLMRLLVFLSLMGAGTSLLVNILVPTGFMWSLIVIAALLYTWLTVPPLLRQGVNYAKRVVIQVIFTAALVVALDFIIGFQGWSVNYALPGLLCAGIAALWAMLVFNRTSWGQYIFYQFLMGIFGFIPLLLYVLGLSNSLVMVLITASLALASLLATVVFGDKTFKSDMRRRFHL